MQDPTDPLSPLGRKLLKLDANAYAQLVPDPHGNAIARDLLESTRPADLIAGNLAQIDEASAMLAGHGDLDFSTKAGIFETFRKLHPILKEQHFLNPKEEEDDPYESTQVTALVANEHGIFGVYSMREVFEYSRYWAVGSGREFALGAMFAEYPKLRTAAAIARVGIAAGATFDRNSGMPMTLYTVPVKR